MGRTIKLWITPTEYVTFQEFPTSLSTAIATRERSIDWIGSANLFLPNPDPVLKKMGKDISIYRDLMADAHLGATVESRKSGVKSLEWSIDRGKAKSRQAKLITQVFTNLDIHRIIGEILDAPLFGYSPIEVIWEKVGVYILPKDMVGKPPEWFVFSQENELLFRTRNNWNGEPLPPRKFLLPRHNPTYQNPYGEPILSRCFWPITFKKGGLKFWVVFAEKYGMPHVVGKHPRGTTPEEQTKMLDMLERMVQDALAVIPDDSSIDILESSSKSASADIYNGLLTFCNMEISKAVLGQTLTTEMQTTGSFAAAKAHLDVREDIVNSDKKIVESTFNELIKWIYEINFGESGESSERAVFSMYEEEAVDKELADRDKVLADLGVIFTRRYFLKAYGFEEEDIASPADSQQKQEFQEGIRSQFPDQQAINNLGDAIGGNKEELQQLAEGMLKPIIRMIMSGKDHEQILGNIAEMFPKMDASALEDMLAKAIFIAETWGKLSAQGATNA